MTPEELQTLPTALAADFKSIETTLRDLDKHLTLRTYIEGYKLGETESKVWQTLKTNKAAVGFIKKGTLANLTRWFVPHPSHVSLCFG
jgi:glutamyl-tRNA synthetase